MSVQQFIHMVCWQAECDAMTVTMVLSALDCKLVNQSTVKDWQSSFFIFYISRINNYVMATLIIKVTPPSIIRYTLIPMIILKNWNRKIKCFSSIALHWRTKFDKNDEIKNILLHISAETFETYIVYWSDTQH